jgi:hypothetical protein
VTLCAIQYKMLRIRHNSVYVKIYIQPSCLNISPLLFERPENLSMNKRVHKNVKICVFSFPKRVIYTSTSSLSTIALQFIMLQCFKKFKEFF